uniref:Uncharacterized protein n=2 Tax=Nymphaea colorata TaxID=210225 RepID=A0A5K1A4N7_9MAGN
MTYRAHIPRKAKIRENSPAVL